jgi:methyl-accepting chemotaxis protein
MRARIARASHEPPRQEQHASPEEVHVQRIATDVRWTWIFGTILILVVVVVIGFLSGITSALNSIDDALGTTNSTLTEVGSDADPLPSYVKTINGNLTAIDKALKPIPEQATNILGSLTSIDQSASRINSALGNTSSSLLSTSSSLVDTSGTLSDVSSSLVDTSNSLQGTTGVLQTIRRSLVDTSGVLVVVNTRARQINAALRSAESPNSQGLRLIPGQADNINASLGGTNSDTTAINGDLVGVNRHLTSICKSTVLSLFPPNQC